jgi:hypothetical protein
MPGKYGKAILFEQNYNVLVSGKEANLVKFKKQIKNL